MVDRILRPGGVLNGRQGRSRWRNECPMSGPRRALINPLTNQFDLYGGQVPLGFGRRHVVVFIRSCDPTIQFALRTLAGNNDRLAVFDAKRFFLGIQSQFGFALLFVRAMASITIVRNDGLNVAVEINGVASSRNCGQQSRHCENDCQTVAISPGHTESNTVFKRGSQAERAAYTAFWFGREKKSRTAVLQETQSI